MSPTVFRDGPFRFFFFPREEQRLHIDVQSADGEAKIWIEPEIEVARTHELSEDFPWFKQATVDTILRLDRPAPGHLRWPDLDVDLSVNSIEHPERHPLKSKL
jgi:hypothetical protein